MERERIKDRWSSSDCVLTTPLGCSVRKPKGPGGKLGSTGRVAGRGVTRPICGHSISQASVLRRRSPASANHVSAISQNSFLWGPQQKKNKSKEKKERERERKRETNLCGNDVELELLPVIVGLLERLNLR